ncbi:ABC transporter permease [Croceivirga sp. JEA036]|uniref:ABC transporter permease n=1 Tax=Croceivirga sp. JEA036 TaxID=2721162 RepID=UPI001439AF0F|nr:ABC transporter permease [Croceivirga sp. JEA036]NJB36844.1 FtsX-like permease family protein [Croceivirga sp. JEA036]
MIYSWLKIFTRHVKKSPLYPIINTLGLVLGVTTFVLILLFVSKELSYEKWNPNLDRIYRPIRLFDNGEVWESAPRIMVKTALEQLPELEDALLMNYDSGILFNKDGKKVISSAKRTTANFFKFFPYPIKYGDTTNLFKDDSQLVLSEEFSKELFGDVNPVGETIASLYRNEPYNFTIAAVYSTDGFPSDEKHSVLRLMDLKADNNDHWGNFNYDAYFMLHKGVDVSAFNKKFDEFYDQNTYESWGITYEQYLEQKEEAMYIENLADRHLFGKALMGKGANTLYILAVFALLILVISAINFINLSISGATKRAKEVAIRKTLGTSKLKVIAQFIFEVALQCALALLVSLALIEIVLPPFNTLMGTDLELLSAYNKWWWGFGIITILILISGLFPGIYLSQFNPVKVLKGNFSRSKSGQKLKRGMIVFQFCISGIFLISAFVIKSQLHYMNNRDLGFTKEQMLIINIRNAGETHNKLATFKQELKKIDGVAAVATGTRPPGTYASFGSNSNVDYQELSFQADMHFIDADFIPTMGIKLNKGKNFTKDWMDVDTSQVFLDNDGDTIYANEIIVNQKLVSNFQFKNPIGKQVEYWGYKGTIIGVVDNYIAKGFDQGAYPALYMPYLKGETGDWGKPTHLMVRLNGTAITETVASIEDFWTQSIEPRFPFKYEFLDQNFAKTFAKQKRLETLVTILSFLMIFISLLGLFAIASHSVQQRYKEVAIRKTLGASEKTLILSLIKEFILIAVIALSIALPISYLLADRWLEDFAYRINVPLAPFAITMVLMLTLTLAVILIQALKALKIDLVAHLKYE